MTWRRAATESQRDRNDIREKQMPEDKKKKETRVRDGQIENDRGDGSTKSDLGVCHNPFPAF